MPLPRPVAPRRTSAVVAGVLATWFLAAPATAQPACDAETGVRVVVDQGPLGGGVRTHCAEDGADLPVAEVLADVGVEVTWVQRYPGAFVCRLDGRPRDLPCADTPPADRFWGLFRAGPGESAWTYSAEGAGSLRVPAGGAVGWRFQDGGELEPPRRAPVAGDEDVAAGPADDEAESGSTTDDAGGGEDRSDSAAGSRTTVVALLVVGVLGAAALLARRRST